MDYKHKCPQQIKVILDRHEIALYRINQIASCQTPLDARDLLNELFDKIYDDTGFHTKNSDIIVRATWEEKEKMSLFILKRPLLSKKYQDARFLATKFLNKEKVQIYVFHGFEDLLSSIPHINFYRGKSDLYERNGLYYLILKYNIKKGHPNNSIPCILKEYADELDNPNIKECFLQEHGIQIVKKKAVATLNEHFFKKTTVF